MKKLNNILNIIIGVFVGLFIGYVLTDVWKLIYHPEFYHAQALPFGTIIMIQGILPSIIVVVCLIIKIIIKYREKKAEE